MVVLPGLRRRPLISRLSPIVAQQRILWLGGVAAEDILLRVGLVRVRVRVRVGVGVRVRARARVRVRVRVHLLLHSLSG